MNSERHTLSEEPPDSSEPADDYKATEVIGASQQQLSQELEEHKDSKFLSTLSSNMLRKAMCFCYNASLHMMESLSQARLCDPIPTLQRAYWYH